MAMSLAIILLLEILILGVAIGAYGLNLLQKNMMNISADLRKIN